MTQLGDPNFSEEDFACKDILRLKSLKKRGFEPKVIFDIGASNGLWSKKMATVFPSSKFYLFEPLVDYDLSYKKSIEEILLEHPQFILKKSLVGKSDQKVEFFIYPDLFSSSILNYNSDPLIRKVRLPSLALGSAIKTGELPLPQFIKMDIQGAELVALEGLGEYLSSVDVLLLETWLVRGYGKETPLLTEISHWLTTFGFNLVDFSGTHRDSQGILITQDCLFINRASSISTTH